MARKKILIIGGGMAGMVAAIHAAELGAKVIVFERNNKIGKKLSVTGNGRCNLTNRLMNETCYHSQSKNLFTSVYDQCPRERMLNIWSEWGLETLVEASGKYYPQSLQASSVIKTLLLKAEETGVQICYDTHIQMKDIVFDKKYKVMHKEKAYYGDTLIVATGGRSYPATGSTGDGYDIAKRLGHSIVDTRPSIVQLVTSGPYNKSMKGLKVNAKLTLKTKTGQMIRQEEDELLFTDYGLSGPVILQLSTEVGPFLKRQEAIEISIDFFPDIDNDELDDYFTKRFMLFSQRRLEDLLMGIINYRLIGPTLKYAELDGEKKCGNIRREERYRLIEALKNHCQTIEDTYTWSQAQVTQGGVNCQEVNPMTLESLKQKQMYLIGEVLDMDGDCGGYNLQWAFSSSIVASESICSNN